MLFFSFFFFGRGEGGGGAAVGGGRTPHLKKIKVKTNGYNIVRDEFQRYFFRNAIHKMYFAS